MESTGAFTANLTGLTPGNTYHFRAKAIGDGTSYGEDTTFITPQLPATVTLTTFDITPSTSQIGDIVNISVTCTNIGGSPGIYPVIIKINGVVEYTDEVNLDPNESQLVTFGNTESKTGTYEVDVNGLSGSFVVQESLGSTQEPLRSTNDSDWLLIAGIVGGTLVAGLTVLFIFRRSMV